MLGDGEAMSAEALPDPQQLLSELEAAYNQVEEANKRLHAACSGAAKGLAALGDRNVRAEADLETAKNHLAQTSTEIAAERDEALMKAAILEAEVTALRAEHEKATTASVELGADAKAYNLKVGELEGT